MRSRTVPGIKPALTTEVFCVFPYRRWNMSWDLAEETGLIWLKQLNAAKESWAIRTLRWPLKPRSAQQGNPCVMLRWSSRSSGSSIWSQRELPSEQGTCHRTSYIQGKKNRPVSALIGP